MRIKCTDTFGNVSYIHKRNGLWQCHLANGTSASFDYAGIGPDEMMFQFCLEDAETPEAALDVAKKHGNSRFKYELVVTK